MQTSDRKKVGVIIGRFQTPYLHDMHQELIKYVHERNDELIILIGCTHTKITKNNPLSFEIRKKMIESWFLPYKTQVIILSIYDCKYDSDWSTSVDKIIEVSTSLDNDVVLYGGRDSFIPHYSGKYRTEVIKSSLTTISATHIRTGISKYAEDNIDFRKGVIYGAYNGFARTSPTVDIAIRYKDFIYLGHKKGESKLRFVGGFVDPSDISLESAAKREVREECGDISTDGYKYLDSFKIDDWRLRGEQDSIMTSFFLCDMIYGRVKASDNIDDLVLVEIEKLSEDIVEPEHKPLMKVLIQRLNEKK